MRAGVRPVPAAQREAVFGVMQGGGRVGAIPSQCAERCEGFGEHGMGIAEGRLPDLQTLDMAGFRGCDLALRAQYGTEIVQAGADARMGAAQHAPAGGQHRFMCCACGAMLTQGRAGGAEIRERLEGLWCINAQRFNEHPARLVEPVARRRVPAQAEGLSCLGLPLLRAYCGLGHA